MSQLLDLLADPTIKQDIFDRLRRHGTPREDWDDICQETLIALLKKMAQELEGFQACKGVDSEMALASEIVFHSRCKGTGNLEDSEALASQAAKQLLNERRSAEVRELSLRWLREWAARYALKVSLRHRSQWTSDTELGEVEDRHGSISDGIFTQENFAASGLSATYWEALQESSQRARCPWMKRDGTLKEQRAKDQKVCRARDGLYLILHRHSKPTASSYCKVPRDPDLWASLYDRRTLGRRLFRPSSVAVGTGHLNFLGAPHPANAEVMEFLAQFQRSSSSNAEPSDLILLGSEASTPESGAFWRCLPIRFMEVPGAVTGFLNGRPYTTTRKALVGPALGAVSAALSAVTAPLTGVASAPCDDVLVAAVVPFGDRVVALFAGGQAWGTLALPQLVLNYYARKFLVKKFLANPSPYFVAAWRIIVRHDPALKQSWPELLPDPWFQFLGPSDVHAIRNSLPQ